MQSDIELYALFCVEAIETADYEMFFYENDFFSEHREPQGGGESG